MSGRTHDVTISGFDLDRLEAELAKAVLERDQALAKIERQAERIRYLEGATNYACGTPLARGAIYRGTVRHDDPTQRELSHLAGVVGALRDRNDRLMGLLRDVERETRQPSERFDEVWAEVREVISNG